jgi:hypothetical protein
MTLDALIMLAGALVASLPFLGFPNSWDNVVLFLIGIFVIALGIIVRRKARHSAVSGPPRGGTTYAESLPTRSGTASSSLAHGTKETME